jgi:hypothetical protein
MKVKYICVKYHAETPLNKEYTLKNNDERQKCLFEGRY